MKLFTTAGTIATFFLCHLCLSTVSAQTVSYEKQRLANGMMVIFHEDHTLPVSIVNIWYYVGGKDEAPGRSGFAHLFEHLMFMGTERVPGSDFDNIMEREGGWNNASTSQDRTNYYSFGPARLLPVLLWLDADRLEDLGRMMTQEKLDKQRNVVRNERRQSYENRPYGRAALRISALMYPEGHPYRNPVIGSHEDLEAATVQDVQAFFSDYYVPANASLVVAGDFNTEQIKPLIDKLFGTLPRGSEPLHRTAKPVRLDGVIRSTISDNVQLARIYLVYHSPAAFQPGDADLDLAAAILSSGISSRLYQALLYENQLAVDVDASQRSGALGSVFSIQATASPGVDLARLEDAIDHVVSRFAETGPEPEELERHKARIEYEAVRSLESLLGKADSLNRYQFYFDEPDSFQRDLDRYRNATRDSVRQAAKEWLTPDARLILKVLPEITPPEENPRSTQPPLAGEAKFVAPLPESFSLENGIRVHHWARHDLPLVEILALLPGGSDQDGSRSGLAALTAEMLDEGAGNLGAVEFNNALDALGARLRSSAARDHSRVTLSVLKRNLREAVPLLAAALQNPRFDESEWRRVKQLHIEDLKRARDNPNSVGGIVGMRLFFGDGHPYSRPVEGTPESVAALDLDDVRNSYAAAYSPRNTALLTAGDLKTHEVRDLLEEHFGQWEAQGGPIPKVAFPEGRPQGLQMAIVDRPGAVQTVISFFMPAPNYSDPKRVPLEMISTILGGTFTSRLNQNLRETHGFTYGARCSFNFGNQFGLLQAGSNVQAAVTGAAIREFLKELEGIRGGDISTDETIKARTNYRTDLLQSYSSLGSTLGSAAHLILRGREFSGPGEDLDRSVSTTSEELNELAREAIPLENGVLLLVGDKKQILQQIRDLDLPPPLELSPAGDPVR